MKYYRRFQKIARNAVLATLIFVLSTEPMLVAAKTPERDLHAEAVDTLVVGGEAYLNSASKSFAGSMELLGRLNTIQNTPVNKISETYISDTIAQALQIAEETSTALGSIGIVTSGIEQLGGDLPDAVNISEAANAGLSQEMRNELSTLGISSANFDEINASASDLYAARQNGISASAQANMRRYGFTQAQIDQIALVVSKRGLLNSGLTTRLEQFRATQDELADTRTGTVVLALQLLGYQIAARQANGIAPRSITEEELQALAEDELRLVVHAAHLNAISGSDPSNETGEGDWWFIEHYAGRAAERLQTAIVESQNRSLVTELFVLRQMKMLAVSARTGDAKYAKAELNGLVALLNRRLTTRAYYQEHQNPGWVEVAWARITAMPALRESVEWPISAPAAKNARLIMQEQVDAAGAENIIGSFDESNEDNNIGGLLLAAGLSFSQLDAGTINETLNQGDAFVEGNAWTWLYAIMTGDTDNPILLIANIIIGFLPVVSILSDVWTLLSTPHILLKAIAIVALVCDIGSTAAFLTVQAELIGLPWLGKAAASVTSGLAKVNKLLLAAYNGMKLGNAVDSIVGLLRVVVMKAGDNVIGRNLGEVISMLGDLLTGALKIWENFSAFAIRAEWELIVKLGINDSTLFIGRVLKTGVSLSDEALIALKYVGDDLIEAGLEVSDDAAKGLGKSAKILEQTELRNFVNRLITTCVGFTRPSTYKRARPALGCDPDLLEKVLASIGKFDDVTLNAAVNIKKIGGMDNFGTLMSKYASNPNDISLAKSIFEGLEKAIKNPKYTTNAIELALSADNADALLLGRYFDQISSIDLASISVKQAFDVSKETMEINVTIDIAGRWADTEAEIALRQNANLSAQHIWYDYMTSFGKNPGDPSAWTQIPEWAKEFLTANPGKEGEILDFVAKYETAKFYQETRGFNIDWYQVKISSGGPEVDVVIEGATSITPNLVARLNRDLEPIFNITRDSEFVVDIYNRIQLKPWMIGRSPNPATHIPPGVIKFLPDGSILHLPFQ